MSYNLGELAIQLFLDKEALNTQKSEEKLAEIMQLTNQMHEIQSFLSELSKATKSKGEEGVDWREDEEKRRMIDALAAQHPHLLESGVYQFQGKEIDACVQRLQNYANHVLAQEQSLKWTQQSQLTQEITSLVEILTNIVKNSEQLGNFIQNAIQKARSG